MIIVIAHYPGNIHVEFFRVEFSGRGQPRKKTLFRGFHHVLQVIAADNHISFKDNLLDQDTFSLFYGEQEIDLIFFDSFGLKRHANIMIFLFLVKVFYYLHIITHVTYVQGGTCLDVKRLFDLVIIDGIVPFYFHVTNDRFFFDMECNFLAPENISRLNPHIVKVPHAVNSLEIVTQLLFEKRTLFSCLDYALNGLRLYPSVAGNIDTNNILAFEYLIADPAGQLLYTIKEGFQSLSLNIKGIRRSCCITRDRLCIKTESAADQGKASGYYKINPPALPKRTQPVFVIDVVFFRNGFMGKKDG